jgi:hypothetical protein
MTFEIKITEEDLIKDINLLKFGGHYIQLDIIKKRDNRNWLSLLLFTGTSVTQTMPRRSSGLVLQP